MKTKRKSAFKTILGFEYISVIKNKAFIISTILVVATLILTSFCLHLLLDLLPLIVVTKKQKNQKSQL